MKVSSARFASDVMGPGCSAALRSFVVNTPLPGGIKVISMEYADGLLEVKYIPRGDVTTTSTLLVPDTNILFMIPVPKAIDFVEEPKAARSIPKAIHANT